MPHIVPDETIAQYHLDAGWRGFEVVRMTQIVLAENLGDQLAVFVNWKPGEPDHLSVDAGLWSLNTYWWPEPTLADRFTPSVAVGEARKIWLKRFNDKRFTTYSDKVVNAYKAWSAYTSARFPQFYSRAVSAAQAVGAI